LANPEARQFCEPIVDLTLRLRNPPHAEREVYDSPPASNGVDLMNLLH